MTVATYLFFEILLRKEVALGKKEKNKDGALGQNNSKKQTRPPPRKEPKPQEETDSVDPSESDDISESEQALKIESDDEDPPRDRKRRQPEKVEEPPRPHRKGLERSESNRADREDTGSAAPRAPAPRAPAQRDERSANRTKLPPFGKLVSPMMVDPKRRSADLKAALGETFWRAVLSFAPAGGQVKWFQYQSQHPNDTVIISASVLNAILRYLSESTETDILPISRKKMLQILRQKELLVSLDGKTEIPCDLVLDALLYRWRDYPGFTDVVSFQGAGRRPKIQRQADKEDSVDNSEPEAQDVSRPVDRNGSNAEYEEDQYFDEEDELSDANLENEEDEGDEEVQSNEEPSALDESGEPMQSGSEPEQSRGGESGEEESVEGESGEGEE
eukprot:TRINITY_DN4744_c0_g1_i1.p1 TRINITY_DN4744_c0_g1~~TRINITY_DN4744_c0_g1_i1.p1  ORF type:complete len:389 (-),score=72.52 TRINITY_DN4744_c0_g1_i1:455-1621(-)